MKLFRCQLTGSGRRHDSLHAWERQAKNSGKRIVDADSPGHTLLTLDGWEDFCRVLESDRAFPQGVADREEIDESVRQPTLVA